MSAFDGIAGLIASQVMKVANAAAEREGVARLDPEPGSHCLVIGFGPGLGLEMLLGHAAGISAVGVDPSGAMLRFARRRNAAAIDDGRLLLRQCTLGEFAPGERLFDAALAVNTLQFLDPIEAEALHLATLLRPGARLMTLTHAWALKRHYRAFEQHLGRIGDAFHAAGFNVDPVFRGNAEKGAIVGFSAINRGVALASDTRSLRR